tara:strand:- start:148 stop:423 length:276 start_codon:yes stop_codon:yes gene_type:complete
MQENLVYVYAVQEPAPNQQGTMMQSVQFLRTGDRKVYSARVFELDIYKPGQVVGESSRLAKDGKEYPQLHPMVSASESRKADKAIAAAQKN